MVFGGTRITGAATVTQADLKTGAQAVADKIAGRVSATDALETLAVAAEKLAHKGKRLAIYDRTKEGAIAPRFARQYLISQERAEHTVAVVKTLFKNASAQIENRQTREAINDQLEAYLSAKDTAIRGDRLLQLVGRIKQAVRQQQGRPALVLPRVPAFSAQEPVLRATEENTAQIISPARDQNKAHHGLIETSVHAQEDMLLAPHTQAVRARVAPEPAERQIEENTGELRAPGSGENKAQIGVMQASAQDQTDMQIAPQGRAAFEPVDTEYSVMEEESFEVSESLASQLDGEIDAKGLGDEAFGRAGLAHDEDLRYYFQSSREEQVFYADEEDGLGGQRLMLDDYEERGFIDQPIQDDPFDDANDLAKLDRSHEAQEDEELILGDRLRVGPGSIVEVGRATADAVEFQDDGELDEYLKDSQACLEDVERFEEALARGTDSTEHNLAQVFARVEERTRLIADHEAYPNQESSRALEISTRTFKPALDYLLQTIGEFELIAQSQSTGNLALLSRLDPENAAALEGLPERAQAIAGQLQDLLEACERQPDLQRVRQSMEEIRDERLADFDTAYRQAAAAGLQKLQLDEYARSLPPLISAYEQAQNQPGLDLALKRLTQVRDQVKSLQGQLDALLKELDRLSSQLDEQTDGLKSEFGMLVDADLLRPVQERRTALDRLRQELSPLSAELARLRGLRATRPQWTESVRRVEEITFSEVRAALIELRATVPVGLSPAEQFDTYKGRIEDLIKAGQAAQTQIRQSNEDYVPGVGQSLKGWGRQQKEDLSLALRSDGSSLRNFQASASLMVQTLEAERDTAINEILARHNQAMREIDRRFARVEQQKINLQREVDRRLARLVSLQQANAQRQERKTELLQTLEGNKKLLAYFRSPEPQADALSEELAQAAADIEAGENLAGPDGAPDPQKILAFLAEAENVLNAEMAQLEAEDREYSELVNDEVRLESNLQWDALLQILEVNDLEEERLTQVCEDVSTATLEAQIKALEQSLSADQAELQRYRAREAVQAENAQPAGRPWPEMVAQTLLGKYQEANQRIAWVRQEEQMLQNQVATFIAQLQTP